MENNRIANASRNIFFGVLLKVYQIIVPFFMRTIIIHFLGIEYLGINSLFVSVIQVLNLAELGVGNAMVYSMYKPIAEGDEKTICALMNLYRKYYNIIGLIIAVVGIILTPFIPRLVKNDLPDNLNIYVLYLFNLFATILSYWVLAYKNCLLVAHQRADIISKVGFITNTMQYILQIITIIVFGNYYIYTIVAVVGQLLTNIFVSVIATKMYPTYVCKYTLSIEKTRDINRRIKDLFTAKLGTTIVNSADTIVISAYLGLSVLAVYQNYYYIMSSVMGFVMLIFTSCTAGIGNSLVSETIDKNYFDFKKLVFLTMWIVAVCISCFVCLYQPFMIFWVGKEYLFDMKAVILFCAYFFLYLINHLSCVYKDASGMWHEDRFRPLIAGSVNLILNLIMVQYIDIYGILLSTIISYILVAMPWLILNLFRLVFKRSPKEYIAMMLKGVCVSSLTAGICYYVCSMINIGGLGQIIVYAVICFLLSNIILYIIYRKDPLFTYFLELCDKITKNKFHSIIDKIK